MASLNCVLASGRIGVAIARVSVKFAGWAIAGFVGMLLIGWPLVGGVFVGIDRVRHPPRSPESWIIHPTPMEMTEWKMAEAKRRQAAGGPQKAENLAGARISPNEGPKN